VTARHLAAVLAFAFAVAGCGTSAANTVGARLNGPTAIVPFAGAMAAKNGGAVHDYLAVASSRGDEIAFLDPGDDNPVLGPGSVFPLVVPTAPQPLLLAAASLGDDTAAGRRADLLVAVSAGSRTLQVVNTWQPTANSISEEVDLSRPPTNLGGEIVSIAAATGATAGRAQVVVGVAGGQLALVTFARGADGLSIARDAAAPEVRTLLQPFSAVHMMVDPGAPAAAPPVPPRLFVATPDPILPPPDTTLGVAEFTMTGALLGAWPLRALDARAGTTVVAVARVPELDPAKGRTFPQGREMFLAAAPLRVYAALDPRTCGVSGRIGCGIVTLDPDAGGIAGDPASAAGALLDPIPFPDPATAPPAVPAQTYRAPVPIPGGTITGIGIALPAAHTDPATPGPARDVTDPLNLGIPQLTTTAAVRTRKTTAVAAVTSSDGRTYLVDLGRFGLLEDVLPLGVLPRSVIQAQSIVGGGAVAGAPLLGLHGDFPPVAAAAVTGVTTDPSALPRLIQTTPGFTPTDSWSVTWQGVLPGLVNRRGLLIGAGGSAFLAAQSSDVPPVVDVAVAAPELGVRPSTGHLAEQDSVFVTCPDGSAAPRTLVAEVVQPSDAVPPGGVAMPGGALRLATAAPSSPICNVTDGNSLSVTFTVRAARFVLASAALGYAGRPELDTPFSFGWQEEEPVPPAPPLFPEDLALARKARRRFYSAEAACLTAAGDPAPQSRGCYANLPWLLDPLAPGPLVAFELGLSPAGILTDSDIDTRVSFATDAGLTPVSRRPTTGGLLPAAVATFDVSALPGRSNDPVRLYTAYADNQVLVFTPAGSSGDTKSIR
jgi:hypothetical protein